MLRVDLNSDLGEAMGDDEAMLGIVSSANIACGFHAGNAMVMTHTVQAALAKGVGIGAHPGYADLEGFGRRPMALSSAEIEAIMAYQIGALQGIAKAHNAMVRHVKPHGALSNLAAIDLEVALSVARAIHASDPGLIFLAPAGSAMVTAGHKLGLFVAEEVFADRNYDDHGNLVPRSHPQAMVHDPNQAAANVLRMVTQGLLRSVNGKDIPCRAQSVCVHGDDTNAVTLARHLRETLTAAGVDIVPLAGLA
ncbi:Lactam utilization protein LamB [Paramagnetospirillum magnetotacticum MS-1]|uniref:5-oxoprolinase subunit A n=1 Tax=Paramagnetospirillum magnetotacticum MS-1 TaxID=272627 RepID=A0A0C2V033_PARME|nr:5-oxoprolinase subunit PxpA [Paramagnetospirillum magnetotacticum]KIL98456.1 Lactam utilization protein LamB [Paramagnetospirillum magnetotacticum MS-1]